MRRAHVREHQYEGASSYLSVVDAHPQYSHHSCDSAPLIAVWFYPQFDRGTSSACRRGMSIAITFVIAHCGGGKSSTPTNNGTPAGTYTFTITGTSGSTTHGATIRRSNYRPANEDD